MRFVKSILTFYSFFSVSSISITLCSLFILYQWGEETLTPVIWFKVVTLLFTIYIITDYKSDEFLYFKNIGISKITLWLSSLIIDTVIFLLLVSLIFDLR